MKKNIAKGLCLFVILFSRLAMAESLQISMLPNYASEETNKRLAALATHLSQRSGQVVEPRITPNFAQFEDLVRVGAIQISYAPPTIYCRLTDRHEVLAIATGGEGKEKMRGVIIARADGDVKKIEDLKNRRVMVVGRNSSGGYYSQKISLKAAGIDVEKDCQIVEAVDNKEENVALAVYLGDAAAGFISETTMEQVGTFIPVNQLQTIEKTAWLPNWAVSVDKGLPAETKKMIREALLKLTPIDPASKALKISKFVPATDAFFEQCRAEIGLPVPARPQAAP